MAIELDQLKKLPLEEKFRIVEALWDDIGASPEPFPVREWHKQEAQRRSAELEADPDAGLTREEVWRRVDEQDV